MVRRILALSSIVLLFTGCGETQFAAKKTELLSKNSVFSDEEGSGQILQPGEADDSTGSIGQPNNGDEETGNIDQLLTEDDSNGLLSQLYDLDESTGAIGQTPGGNESTGNLNQLWGADGVNGALGQIYAQYAGAANNLSQYTAGEAAGPLNQANETTVTLFCSDLAPDVVTNFKRAQARDLPVELMVGDKVCTTDKQAIQTLILSRKISRSDLASLCPQSLPAADKPLDVSMKINGQSYPNNAGVLAVRWARNKDTSEPTEMADSNCDFVSSPLVIHTASDINNPLPIALSSQEDGVDFDLLGANNNYDKVRISWFTNNEYRFLALPDENGEVHGIENLFGDNTSGPDKKFAANGYAALAKYDGTSSDGILRLAKADGFIDRQDPIYRKLRLWLDRNRDGIGQGDEMVSLNRAGITFIDLSYSTDYAERDKYGNETKMKSVVGYRNGSLDLIFDLWFAYRNGGQK